MDLMAKWKTFREVSAAVTRETGKSAFTQVTELLRLRAGRGKLSMDEYYDFRVYRARTAAEQREFAGWRVSWKLQETMASNGWMAASIDKLLYSTLCEGWGIPHPRVRAIYAPGANRHGNRITTLASLDEVRDYLASPSTSLPLFVKPIHALTGLGGAGIASYDRASDRVGFINGEGGPLAEVMDPKVARKGYWPNGILFQELLRPHPEIERRCGRRICTVRVLVLLEATGPRIVQAAFRVATGKNMVDNMRHGSIGNAHGAVDIESGVVLRQVIGVGFREREITHHPDTGESIVGFTLPDWEQGKALCLRAALCFGGFRYQGWDLAFTDRGPMLVELNAPFDMSGSQLAAARGMWTGAVDRILTELGKSP